MRTNEASAYKRVTYNKVVEINGRKRTVLMSKKVKR